MQKKIKIAFLLIAVLTYFNLTGLSQDTSNTIGKVTISSPNAASLGKYGDIPVSYNTGIPNISIPIYDVESGSLKIPISLSYHASGLKVQEQASWVGAGWSLNAGGVITRSVAGAPDDRGCHSFMGFNNGCTNGYYTDTGFNSYLFVAHGSDQCNVGASDGTMADDANFREGYKDGEPDLYFFNFGNFTGKFYFNDDQTPILVPEADFKIQPFLDANMGFQGFILTTPDGVKYYFGQTGNNGAVGPYEITIPSTVQNGPSVANASISSWYLNKIMSADGIDSITFTYQQENYSYYTLSMSPVLSTNYNPNDVANNGYNLIKNFVQGVRLSQIKFANGLVTFTPSASPRTDLSASYAVNSSMTDAANSGTNAAYGLGSISISNTNGFCKKDSFYYAYFQDTHGLALNNAYSTYNIQRDAYRMRLDSVQELSCDATVKKPPYKFSYFSETVPRKLSFAMDHWGFSNGAFTNTNLVPTYTVLNTTGSVTAITAVPGGNRDPLWPDMRGGSLQQITYPTGGTSVLDFEPNDTYCSYSSYLKNNTGGPSWGYDGSTQSSGNLLTTTSNSSIIYEIDLSNNLTNGSCNLEIFDPNNNQIANLTSAAGSGLSSFYFYFNANTTYTYRFFKNSTNGTGFGLNSDIITWIPTTTSGNMMVGGLRIKTITNTDGFTTNNVVTSYVYSPSGVSGGQSSGILYSRPTYVQTIRNDVFGTLWGPFCSAGGCASCDGAGGHTYYISAGSIRPLITFQGNHIGYNEVRVSQTGNGYSIYRYYGSSIWDNNTSDVCVRTITQSNSCDPTIPNFPAPPPPFEPMRGELKYVGHFSQAGNVISDESHFPKFANDPLTTPGHIFIDIPGMYSYTEYNLQSASKIKDSVVSTTYDPSAGTSITTTNYVYYASLYHHEPTRKVSFMSSGDSLSSNMKYAIDFRISTCDAIPDSLTYYNNSVSSALTALNTALSTCTPQVFACTSCRYSNFQQYRRNVNLARIKFIAYRRRSYSGANNLLAACYKNALSTADTLLKPILRLQSIYDNALIETSSWKNQNLLGASFVRYDTSLAPVGFAYPGRMKLISLQAPSSTFTNATVSGNTISKDSRYADESFYTFNNGNPLEVTPKNGVTISYIWDYLNTEPVAKVSNAKNSDIAYSSFEADGKGGWSFTGTPVTDATSPTGTKCYGLSSGNITKSGLTTTTSYVVSYWSKTGASYTVTGSTAFKQGKTINGWTFFEHTVSGVPSVSVSGTGSIDELRLYPTTAQMITYTYQPAIGMSAQCDVDNRISYYQYDALGRLMSIIDQDKNIIKTFNYHYITQTAN